MKKLLLLAVLFILSKVGLSQDTTNVLRKDSGTIYHQDSSLRIINLNPFFTLDVDSTLNYQFQINKNADNYFWYLKNSPIGLRINKDNGLLSFKAQRSYFLSGSLKYDVPYKVAIGVQNMNNPSEKLDTGFTIVFYNLEILPSKVKPSVNNIIYAQEGEPLKFKVLCETGSFPIENILTLSNTAVSNYSGVKYCGDDFSWTPAYDLVNNTDSGKIKAVTFYFVGSTKFHVKDTAAIKIIVRDALNYPLAMEEYNQVIKNAQRYILQLKFTFLQLDKKIRRTKSYRTTFDLTSASTSLTGTILSTSSSQESQRTGKILPSIGLAMVPIKEASVPNKSVDQNQASSIRAAIKRLEYVLSDNMLLGEKDPDISRKLTKIKDELNQTKIQLIEVPVELTNNFTEQELNKYFNSPKVNKKYMLKMK